VSRLCILTVFDLCEMYSPLADIELVSAGHISIMLSWACYLPVVQMRSGEHSGLRRRGDQAMSKK